MKFKRKIRLDRIGSSTAPLKLAKIVEVTPEVECREGAVIIARALSENNVYGSIELPSGRLAKVVRGNIVACVLGARQALHGYMGRVPDRLVMGDTIALLNIGGVAGEIEAPNPDLGAPVQLEVLGQAMREDRALNLSDVAMPMVSQLSPDGPPIALVLGTCMNSGKTYAAAEIIRVLSHAGVKIAAGKVSGVAAMRDLLKMQDNGAMATASFVECGLPSTVMAKDLGAVARTVVASLEKSQPDLILLELGDGILGGYNTESILADESLRARTASRILCANDLVGAWGGVQILEQRGHRPDVMSGPVTDNAVGTSYIERELKVPSANARLSSEALAMLVAGACGLSPEVES